jgi:hypothetical protein
MNELNVFIINWLLAALAVRMTLSSYFDLAGYMKRKFKRRK